MFAAAVDAGRAGLDAAEDSTKLPRMFQNTTVAQVVSGAVGMLKMTLADFSDADMLVRPTPAANHAAWQLGHLIAADAMMIHGVTPDAAPELPAGFASKFTRATATIDDASAFPTKAELFAVYDAVSASTAKWIKGLNDAQLAQPAPESMRRMAPTVGHLVLMFASHAGMHMGQFQVIRRKLGKPLLF